MPKIKRCLFSRDPLVLKNLSALSIREVTFQISSSSWNVVDTGDPYLQLLEMFIGLIFVIFYDDFQFFSGVHKLLQILIDFLNIETIS